MRIRLIRHRPRPGHRLKLPPFDESEPRENIPSAVTHFFTVSRSPSPNVAHHLERKAISDLKLPVFSGILSNLPLESHPRMIGQVVQHVVQFNVRLLDVLAVRQQPARICVGVRHDEHANLAGRRTIQYARFSFDFCRKLCRPRLSFSPQVQCLNVVCRSAVISH